MSSYGSPIRPMGLAASAIAAISGWSAVSFRNAALLAAGQIAFTVTPVGAHSRAAVRVKARRASLAALYSSDPTCALTPLRLHMLMTRPQPRSFIWPKAARIAQNGP